ncbi:5'-nucleotidase [Nocardioides aromaticivorans]|uniref:5'-nucleotidase n=1 Tax=Nocardioides aromaticivorans TaxID=200618 RepID=A0A7Y9ZMR6_9ACTN|nr:ExeM/NucH family extracellular endonuclease [Nocardioides aromaticivorans]NYI47721.1 5'-nucleotidase [Nocardioides aromaticivorans]
MRSAKQFLFGSLGAALGISGLAVLAPTPAQAEPDGSGVVISEVYGAGGFAATDTLPASSYTHDFIELYNPTDAEVSLTGWAVFYGSATRGAGATISNKIALTGSIPAHGHYLVQGAGNVANGAPMPVADATGSINMGSGSGLVILSNQSADLTGLPQGDIKNATGVVDAVGYGTANTFESAADGTALSGTVSAFRNATGTDTDNNSADFSTGAPTPTNRDENALGATDPADVNTYVGVPLSLQLQASGGTPGYTWSLTSGTLPDGVTLSPAGLVSGTPTTVGTSEVTATVTDSAAPTAATKSVTFTITVEAAPEELPIAAIQGTGPASERVDDTVITTGVVTAMYKDPAFASSSFDGMYIQTGGTGGATDGTPGASDAIFVYGANAMPAGVAIGDSVEVTGKVAEFAGSTQLVPAAGGVVELGSPLDPVTPLAIAYPTTETDREAQEGMLLAPTDDFTVTSSYNVNTFAEVGLATGDTPLRQPTEYAGDSNTFLLNAIKADNAARGVVLDDGTSVNYMTNAAAKNQPLPWLTPTKPIRVGAEATLTGPVVLEYRFNTWRFQPTSPVYDDGASVATFENTRPANAAPREVGGDLKIATFNVLNYFNTTGQQYVANGAAQTPPVNTQCSYYEDRQGNPIANNTCGVVTNGVNAGNGPRGAATTASLERQRAKIVTAINLLDADIVGLQEVEASLKLVGETDRDDALRSLVDALNDAAGAGTWRFVHSPGEATLAASVTEQDVIRPAFIYRTASVEPVGQSDILFGTTEFANAREPLAQAFKAKGALDDAAFAVILNHFKSKGDSQTPATGDNANNADTGAFNGDRTRQATRLVQFANEFAAARDIDAVFLAGDFNSYSKEDPIRALEQGGFELIDSTENEESYSFSGLSGSLDHVLGNSAALNMVTGADIWDINAAESVAFQYSRYNYNVTDFWQPNQPFAASDHNPEIIGIDVPEVTGSYKKIQIVGTNDFHGRILPSGGDSAGASVLSGAVKELRADNPNTVFVAAGDLIGASTFESFIQDDKPTIDALNAAGLDVSAVGNHELDQGYDDLVNRVMAPYDAETNPLGGAQWKYIAANLKVKATGDPAVPATWIKTVDGVEIGFVGAVTEDLPALVSPDGIADIEVTDIVDSVNAEAADLRANGADLVVMLVHEGSASTSCTSPQFTDEATTWGNITQNVSSDVDAIVSGHTHLAYNCSFPVADWDAEGRTVTKRPVVSAGQYGQNLNQLVFTYDNGTGDLVAVGQEIIGIAGTGYLPDPAIDPIVTAAKNKANELGAQVLGKMEGPFSRAKLANGTTENRGGESTLGNQVAEVQRWATEKPESGSAQIAFMNPGGLRDDMKGTVNGSVRDLTYKQAAVVQPFANTLVNMDLTGAQIETVLEQQWQRTSTGAVPSRPFLRLGVSKGFTYTYEEKPVTVSGTATFQGEVTGMWLNGEAIDLGATYSVTVNSFLASGGDNFFEFANGSGRADTGKVDLEAMVDYMAQYKDTPLPVDYGQRAVEVELPADAPASYVPGDHVKFDISSWTMSTADDVKDTEVQVKLGDQVIGTATLDNTIGTAVYDQYGTAAVDVVLPEDTPDGNVTLSLVGAATGTESQLVIAVDAGEPAAVVNDTPPTVTGTARVGRTLTATNGTWTPAEVTFAYQWLANGTPIANATAKTLKLTGAHVGKKISVRVTASADGYTDGVATSAETAAVAKGPVNMSVTTSPSKVIVKSTRAKVAVTLTNPDGVAVTGQVTVSATGLGSRTVTLVGGKATVTLPVFPSIGTKTVTVRYLGSSTLLAKSTSTSIFVVRR